MANLDDKIDSIEDKLADEYDKMNKNISNSIKNQSEERRKIEDLINENDKKLMEVEANLLHQVEIIKKEQKVFKCDECGENFKRKGDRRNHIEQQHPKRFSCDHCDLKFEKSWIYEKHLEIHSLEKDKKCEVCGKAFYLEWRFRQHMLAHENPYIRKCHYYNNSKVCPFEQVGCKFKHVKAEMCQNTHCETKLCPKQHNVI